MPQILMPYTVHLDHTLRVTPLSTLFAKGDSAAHRFELTILRAGVQEDLIGCTVMCKFYRMADSSVVSVPGSVEDGKAVSVLKKACYDYIGRFALTISIKNGEEEETTVFYGDGYMHGQNADTVNSGEYIIYDINTLLEKIAEIDAATQAANTATENANTAASNANTARDAANTAANTANTAATNANTAKDAANAAAGKIDNMTVSANPVETGTATAELTTVDGHYHLALGLPKGDTGATPRISVQVQTGAAGSEASVSVSGTAEKPVIHLTIPRGDVGDIGALTINGKTPDAGGTVTLEIGDISGLSDAIANAGGVKTVAGVTPDSAGNVALNPADLGAATAEEVSSLKDDLADAWTAGKTYVVGDYCISGNRLYKCKTAHTAGSAFNADYWDATIITAEIQNAGLKIDTLWENPNPGSAFSDRKIEVNISGYSIIFVVFLNGISGALDDYKIGFVYKDKNNRIEFNAGVDAQGYYYRLRTREYITGESFIQFYNAQEFTVSGVSVNNQNVIPVKICGVK